MNSEDLLSNPYFLIYLAVFACLVTIWRIYVIKKSEKEKNKVGGFAAGVVPVRASFFDFLNKKYIFKTVLVGLFFMFFFAVGINGLMDNRPVKEVLPMLLFPLIFVAALFDGYIYKRVKKSKGELTGLSTRLGMANFFKSGEGISPKTWIRWEIVGLLIFLVFLLFKLLQLTLADRTIR